MINQRISRLAARNWYVLLLVTMAAVIAAAGVTLATTPVYQATAGVYVGTGDASDVTDLSQGSQFTQQQVKNYADIATRQIVLDPVISDLNLRISPATLARSVTASAPLGTSIVEITAEADTAAGAAAIANAVTTNLVKVARDLSPQSLVSVTRIEGAVPPASPASPKTVVNLALGLLFGLLLSALAIYLREKFDNRVRSADDLGALVDKPLLGEILYDRSASQRPLVVRGEPEGIRAEAFRALRANLEFVRYGKRGRSFVVTSSVAAEGKTTTCANLAIALADAGERVLVIDADLRRPSLSSYFGLTGEVGLTDVLIGSITLDEAVQAWSDRPVSILPAGSVPPNPSELLQSKYMQELLKQANEHFTVVLIDAPPLLGVSDAAVLAKRTSGAVVICAVGSTRRTELSAALETLNRVHGKTLGLVLTMARTKTSSAYVYGMDARRVEGTHRVADVPG